MLTQIIRFVIVVLLIMLPACNRDGALLNASAEEVSSILAKDTPRLIDKFGVTGLSVGVIRDGRLSILESFGYRDVSHGRELDEHTVFRAASLGKPVFAYIVVALAKQGRLDLDAPLSSYIKQRVVEGEPRSEVITAKMVLSHSAGLPNLNVKASEVGFAFEPGNGFMYSGYGYLYLQKVVETVSAKSLEQLAEEIVFRPIGMSSSSFVWRPQYRANIASSYDVDGKRYDSKEFPDIGYSAWSLFTTMPDYSKFVAHIIDTASDPDSVSSLLLRPTVTVAEGVTWGLGWGLQDTVPNPSFWHWGSMAGFRHFVVGYPKEKVAVIVMSNSANAFKMEDAVMAKAIGGKYPAYDWF